LNTLSIKQFFKELFYLEEDRDILFTLKTSLTLLSVWLLKRSACGYRARSTPHTSLEPARPRGKQRQSFGNFYKSLLGYCTSKSRASSKFRFNPTSFSSLRPGLYIPFEGSFHDPILVCHGYFHDMVTFLFMTWPCFLSWPCHAFFHSLVMLLPIILSCFFRWPGNNPLSWSFPGLYLDVLSRFIALRFPPWPSSTSTFWMLERNSA